MRLICPSCGAQYEVDESVIPDTGRDVQCSNCGHAWFQSPAVPADAGEAATEEVAAVTDEREAEAADDDVAPEVAAAEDVSGAEEEPALADDAGDTDAAAEDVSEAEAEPAPADDAGDTDTPALADEGEPDSAAPDEDTAEEPEADGDDDAPLPAASKSELRRRTLDEAVLGVLREEAERENRVRKVEETALESQPDLGLAAVSDFDESQSRDRVVRVRGDEDDLDDDALVTRASRRELLPDIEEIKSTLRATSERGDEPAAMDAPETLARRQRSGFRRGFLTALILAFIVVLVYVLAPAISNAVPALEPALTAYVDAVNAVRIWLDTQMQALTQALKG
jgi:predicted Zn finger-like uncharacterized protein